MRERVSNEVFGSKARQNNRVCSIVPTVAALASLSVDEAIVERQYGVQKEVIIETLAKTAGHGNSWV